MHIVIQRYGSTPFGTFGHLIMDGFECQTLENEWLNNEPWVSCIPAGMYPIHHQKGLKKRGAEWRIEGVPGRTDIEFHVGNTHPDTAGCVLLGDRLGYISGKWAILSSRVTCGKFNNILRGYESGNLEIRSPEPHGL